MQVSKKWRELNLGIKVASEETIILVVQFVNFPGKHPKAGPRSTGRKNEIAVGKLSIREGTLHIKILPNSSYARMGSTPLCGGYAIEGHRLLRVRTESHQPLWPLLVSHMI